MQRFCYVVFTLAILLFGSNVDTGFIQHVNSVKSDSLEKMKNSLTISFNDDTVLEYSRRLWNTSNLINEFEGDLEVSDNTVNMAQLGTSVITYTVSDTDEFGQTVSKSYTRSVEVVDTVMPEIKLNQDVVIVDINGKLDVLDNIKSVSDSVDGDLPYVSELAPGTYTVTHNVNVDKIGTYQVNIRAEDCNGNITEARYLVQISKGTYNHTWDGTKLTPRRGTIYGPSGKETYYNLPMQGVVSIMRRMGNNDPYWEREDGCKMLGNYIMVAADLEIHPRGSYVQTSLGMGIVCDTGAFAMYNPYQIDIAVTW